MAILSMQYTFVTNTLTTFYSFSEQIVNNSMPSVNAMSTKIEYSWIIATRSPFSLLLFNEVGTVLSREDILLQKISS